jgi:predicted O-linked N-acetylglucosamine transferase (SPINDLY family)
MADDGLLTALAKITTGDCTLAELIGAAEGFLAAGRPDLAAQVYKVWIGFNPDHPQLFAARFNCAGLLTTAGDLAGARTQLEAAVAQKPDFLPALINLGGVLERQGDLEGGLARWREVVSRPTLITHDAMGYHLAALKQLGRVLGETLLYEAAESAMRHALEIEPHQRDVIEQFFALRMGQCKWPVVETWEGMTRADLVSAIHPLSAAAYADDPLLQLASAAAFVDEATADRPLDEVADRRDAPVAPGGRRLRIGYVSSDLRDHAIGYLMAELFELHDRGQLEVFAYYCGRADNGALNGRIRLAVEHWIDIREMTDEAAARRIAEDEIDILVDVNGHTRDARLGVFARRPAPIQVNWLGFPGTMGSPFHNYVIADPNIIPPGAEIYYSEKVVRLACYQPNDRKRRVAPEPPTRRDAGLPDDAVVFCCFNGPQKINRPTFTRWMEILKRTPASVLWLLESAAETQANLRTHALQAGVDPGRLIFAPKQANAQHLSRYRLADLFLDTAPYGAHTTASDALWMGVPVLTFWGRSFAARVCGSLVSAAGLPDMVCEGPRAFVEKAVALGRNSAARSGLRARLEAGRATCTLFDMERLAADLTRLYQGMAADYRAGKLPRPDLANLDAYLEVGAGLDHESEVAGAQDYAGRWSAALARRHRARPMPADRRAWTAADIAAAEPAEASAASAAPRRARAAGGAR